MVSGVVFGVIIGVIGMTSRRIPDKHPQRGVVTHMLPTCYHVCKHEGAWCVVHITPLSVLAPC